MFALDRLVRSRSQRLRPVATPTLWSLSTLLVMLGGALFLLERPSVNHAEAAEVETRPRPLVPSTPAKPVISLRDRLITGLQARLRSELAFVEAVVAAVEAGKLPERLVNETFFWARERARPPGRVDRQRRPIIYFRPALIARINRINRLTPGPARLSLSGSP